MSRVEELIAEIQALSPEDLHALRAWFANIEADREARIDLAESTLRDHQARRPTEL